MIEIEVSKNSNRVHHSGEPVMVAVELAASIGAIYNGYKIVDSTQAELFRLAILAMLTPDSGVWTPGDGDLTTVIIQENTKKAVPPPTKVRAPHRQYNSQKEAAK